METSSTAPAATAHAYPPMRQAAWLMVLLFISANLYNIDRLIVGVLADQIKTDIGVTDVQMSLLIGAAYAMLGVVAGLFLGLFIDRANRRTVLAVSLTLWSLATIGGGLSANFGQLFLSRALVGLGEAALAPGAMSLIADLFPPGKRGRALAIYSVGSTMGGAMATAIPGLIVGANLHWVIPSLDLVLTPWRLTFVVCGVVGPLIALLMVLTAKEPHRQGMIAGAGRKGSPLKTNLAYLGSHADLFAPHIIGMGLFYMAWLAILSWTAVFLTRHFGLKLGQVAGLLSLTVLCAGLLGYFCAGLIADLKSMRSAKAKYWMMILAPVIALPSAFALLAPTLPLAIAMLAAMSFAAPILNVGNGALVQDIAPNNMRGFVLSLCSVSNGLLGTLSGPLLVAMATDHLWKDPLLIGRSLSMVVGPALAASCLCYLAARAGLIRHLAKGSSVADVTRAGGSS